MESSKFKDVESTLEIADLEKYEPGGEDHFTSEEARLDPAGVLRKICSIYQIVRPILSVLSHFPLPRVKRVIKIFMDLMDSICTES